jgi:predicted dienelactone hydrolase
MRKRFKQVSTKFDELPLVARTKWTNRESCSMINIHSRSMVIASVVAASLCHKASAGDKAYDPLAIPDSTLPAPMDVAVKDTSRSREIPLRIYQPAEQTNAANSPAAVVLFSHGLGGSRNGSPFLGKHWASRGYVAVFLQHPGSDESVWRDKRLIERMSAMRQAANLSNFLLRAKDVAVVLDELDRWNQSKDHPLSGKLEMSRVGMSGHSFGAVTTQAVSGQRFPLVGAPYIDKRIKAAIAFSPSGPKRGIDPAAAFGEVKIPWMLMTGTKDQALIGDTDVKSRLSVFPALPAGAKYELVLDNAEHSAFTDRPLPGDREKRNPNHHRAILALSTAFWDAYLCNDEEAKSWLDGDGPRSALEEADRWQKK